MSQQIGLVFRTKKWEMMVILEYFAQPIFRLTICLGRNLFQLYTIYKLTMCFVTFFYYMGMYCDNYFKKKAKQNSNVLITLTYSSNILMHLTYNSIIHMLLTKIPTSIIQNIYSKIETSFKTYKTNHVQKKWNGF